MAINIKDKYTKWFAIGVALAILTYIITLIPAILAISTNDPIIFGLYVLLSLTATGYVIENWLGKVINVKMKR